MAHGLTSVQVSDQVVVLRHFDDRVGQSYRHGEGETLGDGDDQDGHADDEVLDELVQVVDLELATFFDVFTDGVVANEHDDGEHGERGAKDADPLRQDC